MCKARQQTIASRTPPVSDVFLRGGLLLALRLLRRTRLGFGGRDEFESQLVLLPVPQHAPGRPILELAEQYLVRQRLLDVVLDDTGQRTGAKGVVIALLAQPA